MLLPLYSGLPLRRSVVALAALMTILPGVPALADHAEGHAGVDPFAQVVNQANTQLLSQFQQPVFSPIIVPTDVASWGGEQGRSRGLTNMEGPPDLSAWLFHGQARTVERDPRYSFTGKWSYLRDIDQFAENMQGKIPALAKVKAELKPCGDMPQSMPPVPQLPKPDSVGKAPQVETPRGVNLWKPLPTQPAGKQLQGIAQAAKQGRLSFSRFCNGFIAGEKDSTARIIVATPGTQALAKTANSIVVKVGRAYVFNGAAADLELESGRVGVTLPPGATGIIDTAANGLTQFLTLSDSKRRAIRVFDLCNPSLELGRVDAGRFVTVAPEDAIVEDLISVHGISETVQKVTREEGYLLVFGRFSLSDAVARESILMTPAFQAEPMLRQQKAQLAIAGKQPEKASGATLATGITAGGVRSGRENGAMFMPTRGARYGAASRNELVVADGAVLVKAGAEPVVVSAEVNRRKVMTEVKNDAVVMVSALDGRLIVLNLTDKLPGACMIYMPGHKSGKFKTIMVNAGQVAELYINDGLEPASTVLAYQVIDKKDLPEGVGLLLAKYDYLAAMKRFNLSFALPSPDLNRVLKTMAATAYLLHSRR